MKPTTTWAPPITDRLEDLFEKRSNAQNGYSYSCQRIEELNDEIRQREHWQEVCRGELDRLEVAIAAEMGIAIDDMIKMRGLKQDDVIDCVATAIYESYKGFNSPA